MSAKNFNEGKVRLGLVVKDCPNALKAWAQVREAGCQKYSRMNWAESKGTDDATRFLDENMESILRHLLMAMMGETHDEESGLPHMAHVMCRAAFDLEYHA
jgi:hypothetical protein